VELDLPGAADSDSSVSPLDFADLGITEQGPSTLENAMPKEPQIEFLCPTGHRLHGPASLQGRPGECPECGSRFRIPSYEDISVEEQPEQELSLGRADGSEGSDTRAPVATQQWLPPELPSECAPPDEKLLPTTSSPLAPDASTPGQTMAALFVRLWRLRREAMTVELRLRDGEIIIPDQFLEKLSQPSHGVFAVKEADGSTSLVAVAWESVGRATLRGLSEVPGELAD
jgi:hypothetical protein